MPQGAHILLLCRRIEREHLLEGTGQARVRKGGLGRKGIAEAGGGGNTLQCGPVRFPGSCGFTHR